MKIYLDTVGCRLNQSEIETYAWQFRSAGHVLVPSPEEAELVVVNTCTVTAAAASDSRQKIRQAAHAGAKEIAVTGCWSSLNPEEAISLPTVSRVIHNLEKDHLVSNLLQVPEENFELGPIARQPLPGTLARTRAFIKVQDGCNNRCAFCATTLARGPGRSRTIEDVLSDIHAATYRETGMKNAAKEIVLTGVHLGSWGQDFSPSLQLSHLVLTILRETDVPRVRLSSLEPWDLDEEFFSLWEEPRLCRQLHLPLQSGSETTLQRMSRKTTPDSFTSLVTAARRAIPDIAITTDVLTGFPGETECEFTESMDFVRQMQFADGHVFTYSARPGTAAACMPNQVQNLTRKERNAQMRTVLAESKEQYQARFLNRPLPVLWESANNLGANNWHLKGLTDNYLRVNTHSTTNLWNRISLVQLTDINETSMYGEVIMPNVDNALKNNEFPDKAY